LSREGMVKVRERCMETARVEISTTPTTWNLGDCGLYEDVETRGCAPEDGIKYSEIARLLHSRSFEEEKAAEAGVEQNEGSVWSQQRWVVKAVAIRRDQVHGSLDGGVVLTESWETQQLGRKMP